jgi:hypothetical protein
MDCFIVSDFGFLVNPANLLGGSMKKIFQYAFCFMSALVLGAGSISAMAFSSPTIGGPTGVITTPNAQIGWDGNDVAIDAGFHYVKDDDKTTSQTPKVNLSLFKCLEVGVMGDMQKYKNDNRDNDDYTVHAKFRFYPLQTAGNSSLAVGYKNMQLNYDDESPYKRKNQQVYLAATYGGNFFSMPAETSLVFGKTWGKGPNGDTDYFDDMIDFSMSFDLDLLPNLFKGYVHSISEFSNYSYSSEPVGADTLERGAFNTGLRLALLKNMNRFKLNVDILWLDVLDKNRCWGAGVAGGAAF